MNSLVTENVNALGPSNAVALDLPTRVFETFQRRFSIDAIPTDGGDWSYLCRENSPDDVKAIIYPQVLLTVLPEHILFAELQHQILRVQLGRLSLYQSGQASVESQGASVSDWLTTYSTLEMCRIDNLQIHEARQDGNENAVQMVKQRHRLDLQRVTEQSEDLSPAAQLGILIRAQWLELEMGQVGSSAREKAVELGPLISQYLLIRDPQAAYDLMQASIWPVVQQLKAADKGENAEIVESQSAAGKLISWVQRLLSFLPVIALGSQEASGNVSGRARPVRATAKKARKVGQFQGALPKGLKYFNPSGQAAPKVRPNKADLSALSKFKKKRPSSGGSIASTLMSALMPSISDTTVDKAAIGNLRRAMQENGFAKFDRDKFAEYQKIEEGARALQDFRDRIAPQVPRNRSEVPAELHYSGRRLDSRAVSKRVPVGDGKIFLRTELEAEADPRLHFIMLVDVSFSMCAPSAITTKMRPTQSAVVFFSRYCEQEGVPQYITSFGSEVRKVPIVNFGQNIDTPGIGAKPAMVDLQLGEINGSGTNIGVALDHIAKVDAHYKARNSSSSGLALVFTDGVPTEGANIKRLTEQARRFQETRRRAIFVVLSEDPEELEVARQIVGEKNVIAPRKLAQLGEDAFRVIDPIFRIFKDFARE